MIKCKIKKNDTVLVVRGNDKGKRGKVLKVFPEERKIIVERVNIRKKAQKPTKDNPQGGIIEKELPISMSNVMIICNKCSSAVRVGRKKLEDNRIVRYCKNCKELLD
ncbi:MAG TPA: 50S ribosomal protein L24 [bacterium]|nr:50S ribosomal protein L24 [bacterium]HPQ18519.1 50S ribosomal protein L24 [bacterium]